MNCNKKAKLIATKSLTLTLSGQSISFFVFTSVPFSDRPVVLESRRKS